jgi:2-iminobutanoate/2-iminopropanoate deaminase
MMTKKMLGAIIALSMFAGTAGVKAQDARRTVIFTPNAPKPIGPYSQAIHSGKTIYLSGQIAIDPETNQFKSDEPIEDQTRRVLNNLTGFSRQPV